MDQTNENLLFSPSISAVNIIIKIIITHILFYLLIMSHIIMVIGDDSSFG